MIVRTLPFALLALVLLVPLGVEGQEATTELYGDFRYSYNRVDAGAATYWTGVNNASRLGVRSEAAAGSLTLFADLQAGAGVDGGGSAFTPRYYLAGVRGEFGTLTVGRHSPAYKMAGVRLDPFYDTSTLGTGGGVPTEGVFGGASFGLSSLTNGWADRTVAWSSPAFGGFTANAAAYVDPDSDHDYGLGIGYRAGGLEVGVQYHDVGGGPGWAQSSGIEHAFRTHASLARDAWSVGASHERVAASEGEDQTFFLALGTVHVTPDVMFAASVGHVGDGSVQDAAGTGYHLGVFYRLLPQARVHALYSGLDPDGGPSRGNLAVGLTYQFTLGSS
ncbi:MAG: porin [Gemmatimonadales bacterium]|nr:MAG: porin [Gemmatimonadales bacterium]